MDSINSLQETINNLQEITARLQRQFVCLTTCHPLLSEEDKKKVEAILQNLDNGINYSECLVDALRKATEEDASYDVIISSSDLSEEEQIDLAIREKMHNLSEIKRLNNSLETTLAQIKDDIAKAKTFLNVAEELRREDMVAHQMQDDEAFAMALAIADV